MNMASRILLFVAFASSAFSQAATAPPLAIDASKFASLQAALDALPESGGIVTIPPGTYELSQPLLVKSAETRIQGAGASTHLINKNEEGQPLMLIKPANLDKNPKAQLWRVQLTK